MFLNERGPSVRNFAADPTVDLVEDRPGDADAAGLGDALEPRRDVDAITVDAVPIVDDVAHVDAHAETHAARLGNICVALRHHRLDLDRAFNGPGDAGEFG